MICGPGIERFRTKHIRACIGSEEPFQHVHCRAGPCGLPNAIKLGVYVTEPRGRHFDLLSPKIRGRRSVRTVPRSAIRVGPLT
jgi:hypothetical protein